MFFEELTLVRKSGQRPTHAAEDGNWTIYNRTLQQAKVEETFLKDRVCARLFWLFAVSTYVTVYKGGLLPLLNRGAIPSCPSCSTIRECHATWPKCCMLCFHLFQAQMRAVMRIHCYLGVFEPLDVAVGWVNLKPA